MTAERYSTRYTIGFAAAVCVVCSVLVSTSAVMLRDRQEENERLDRQEKLLSVVDLLAEGEEVGRAELQARYDRSIRPRTVALGPGDPDHPARVLEVPAEATVYDVVDGDRRTALILPVHGLGLWSVMHGYLALEPDGVTVRGLSFYRHGETPGLGARVDEPTWRALWRGRRAFDDEGAVSLSVIKGRAGPAADDPHRVDGLSGATLTGTGVSHMMDFWLGDAGYGPYLATVREGAP